MNKVAWYTMKVSISDQRPMSTVELYVFSRPHKFRFTSLKSFLDPFSECLFCVFGTHWKSSN